MYETVEVSYVVDMRMEERFVVPTKGVWDNLGMKKNTLQSLVILYLM